MSDDSNGEMDVSDQPERPEPDDPMDDGVSESDAYVGRVVNAKGGDLSGVVNEIKAHELERRFLGDTQPVSIPGLETTKLLIDNVGVSPEKATELKEHIETITTTQMFMQGSIMGYKSELEHETVRNLKGDSGSHTNITVGGAEDDDED